MSLFDRPKPKWWSSVLIVAILLMSVVQPALAAPPATGSDLINLLRQYNIVRGDDRGDLQLGSPITRAQMAVILVRLTGRESEAETLKGVALFSDTKGHWAEGYVASARINGLMKGFEDGTFHPEEPVTYAQAFTMVLRLVGREPDASNWPTSALLDAMDMKFVPSGFTGIAMLSQPAVRGEIFASVGMALTNTKTADGRTYFQKWVDSTAPELAVSDGSTFDAGFDLKGSVKDASGVRINGETVTLTGDSFTKKVDVKLGENSFKVEAFDLAGNTTVKDIKVIRKSPAASITITGPAKVGLGGTATYQIKAFDSDNKEVPATGVQARVTGSIGTFDAATGTFTASQSAAMGKIEVTLGTASASANVQVLGAYADAARMLVGASNVAYTKPMTVTVQVLGADGSVARDDYGRSISLTAAGVAGITVSPATVKTVAGEATFTVRGAADGVVTLMATSAGLPTATEVAAFTTTTRVVLATEQGQIPTDGSTSAKVRAELRDENGNLVVNKTGQDIYVTISVTGPGSVMQSRLRIAPNASSSAQTQSDGLIVTNGEAGTISVSGTLEDSTLKYTVDRTSIRAYTPTVGSGTRFRLTPISGTITLGGGEPAEFVIQLVDANGSPVSASDYAFQVEVTTSNNETKTNGVPEGMRVQLGDNAALNPVSDGKSGGDDIVARIDRGNALIKVFYDKPGVVTLKAVQASGTSEAYNTDGAIDAATSSSSSWVTDDSKAEAVFKTTANTIKLTADSDLFGKDTPAINNRAGSSRSYTLHAYVAYSSTPDDATAPRYWVPGQVRTLDLHKNGVKVTSGEVRDGKVDFTISAPSTDGTEDKYEVKDPAAADKLRNSNPLFVRAVGTAPLAPGFPVTLGVPSLTLDQVLASDTGLEISLPIDTTQRYVMVRVYYDNSSALIYSAGPIDVSSGTPRVVVPKEKLPTGVHSYNVRYVNAAGDSGVGVASYPVTNFTVSSRVTISSARYDGVNQVLYVYGEGFSSDDALATEKLQLVDPTIIDPTPNDGDHPGIAYLGGAVAEYVNAGTYKLKLTGLTSALDKIEGFAGSVRLSASIGWITKASGLMGGEDLNNSVTPMAFVSDAAYDRTNRRLVIYGRGFKSGTLKSQNLKIGAHALNETGMSVSIPYDTEIWVTLNSAAVTEVEADATVKLTALDDWFTDGNSTPVGRMAAKANIDVFGFVKATSVTYFQSTGKVTVSGNGFAGGRVAAGATVQILRGGLPALTLTGGAVTPDGKVTFSFASDADKGNFETNYNTYASTTYLSANLGWFEVPVGAGYRASSDIPASTGLRVGFVRN